METLFASGRMIDLILVGIALQAVGLWGLKRFAGVGPGLKPLIWTMAAGLALMLAIRASLTGADWPWVGGFMAGGLMCHVIDLRRRWKTPPN